MSERYVGHDTFASDDPLAPEHIEATILAAQSADGSETRETALVRALAAAYALAPEADAALARVHARLSAATLAYESPCEEAERFEVELPQRHTRGRGPLPLQAQRVSRLGASLRAVAAVLVVALLGAGFYAALHGRGATPSRPDRPARPEQPGWHDVGITQARATQPLEFDPVQGVRYAVNEVTGDIYVCGGSGHIWYSANGGASYAPFPVIPPASPQGSVSCTIATVPGDSGLFIQLAGASGPTQHVAHVSFPGRLAAQLQPPSSAVSLADPSERITVNPDQFLAMLFTGSMIGPVRMAGGRLFATVWDVQLSRTVLLGTPDFGQHWYWLDAPITAHSPVVVDKFAVDPADPSRLFLGVHPGPYADGVPSVAMSVDGGKTWQSLLSDSPYGVTLAGASKTSVFDFTQDDPAGHTALLRLDFTTPGAGWQRVTQLPAALTPPGGAEVLDVGPDGTVYAEEGYSDGQDVTLRVYTLAPGASTFRLVWPQATLTPPTRHFAFAIGGIWPGGRPALYVDSGSALRTSPALYRLALSVPTSPPDVSTPSANAISSPAASTCTGTAADLPAIQPGGLGAELSTFPTRWGAQLADDNQNVYFGQWPDTGWHKIGVVKPGDGQRVSSLSYYPDTTQHLSLSDAESIARSFLPTDAKPISLGAPTDTSANPVTFGFCSPAYYEAFPPGSPNPSYGRIAVNYWKDASGDVTRIDLSTLVAG